MSGCENLVVFIYSVFKVESEDFLRGSAFKDQKCLFPEDQSAF